MEAAQVIAKKDLTDWKKWEFGALDAFRSKQKIETVDATASRSTKATQDTHSRQEKEAVILPTAEQIEAIYQQAREEGMQAGYQAGKKQAAQESAAERQRLYSLIDAFGQELIKIDQSIAQDVLALTMELARKMIGQALQVSPELLLPVIEAALRQLPATTQSLRLKLHPQDAVWVREHFTNQPAQVKWEIVEDSQIEPGGCLVESGGCEVDATLATRWQRILASLGQEQPWLS